MRSKRLILGFALVALAVGYIELRLPPPVTAQGRNAVYERLAVTGAVKLEAFRGQISAFNGSCPTDWNEVTALRGRMIVGLVSGGTLALSVGTALTNGASRRGGTAHTHSGRLPVSNVTHTTSTSLLVSDIFQSNGSGTDPGGLQIGTGRMSALNSSSNYTPPAPYVQFRYCEYQP